MSTMEWKTLLQPDALDFIKAHESEDVAKLALRKPPGSKADYPALLSQIKARQKARRKLPLWFASAENLIFPSSDIVEQASSQATALYKAGLVKGHNFVDLTTGLGVDAWALSKVFETGLCIDQDAAACEILTHNFASLGCANLRVEQGRAEGFVLSTPPADLVYIDPQRRGGGQKGKFLLEQNSPDILQLLPALKEKARSILLKTSPMLDISATLEKLGMAAQVHVLEYDGDCKEVLYLMNAPAAATSSITAVSLDEAGQALQSFSFTPERERDAQAAISTPLSYLYEPGPAFMKAGGFNVMAVHYGVSKLHPDTHLYTSDALIRDFPGRIFEVRSLYPVRADKIPLDRASLTVRNFPDSAENLRKKLKLKDGGPDTLFACIIRNDEKTLIHTVRIFG